MGGRTGAVLLRGGQELDGVGCPVGGWRQGEGTWGEAGAGLVALLLAGYCLLPKAGAQGIKGAPKRLACYMGCALSSRAWGAGSLQPLRDMAPSQHRGRLGSWQTHCSVGPVLGSALWQLILESRCLRPLLSVSPSLVGAANSPPGLVGVST